MFVLLFYSLFGFSGDSYAALSNDHGLQAESQLAFVICRSQDLVRTIRIRSNESGRCETLYSKGGKDQVVGYGQEEQSCSNFLQNIKENLQGAHWSCRQIEKARVLSSHLRP